jgi:hypothetical protein
MITISYIPSSISAKLPMVCRNISMRLYKDASKYGVINGRRKLRNTTSELLFAGMCGINGFNITFESHSKDDYDFIINGYPAQMKTSNKPVSFSEMVDSKKRRKESVDHDRIT